MNRTAFLLVSIAALFIALPAAYAAKVKAVKGKKVLIELEGDTYKAGDILKIENGGKSVGLAKVTKVKGALAEAVFKGKAEKGFAVKLRPAKEKKSSSTAAADTSSSATSSAPSGSSKIMWGGMLGFNSTNADVKLPNSGPEVALSGSGFSAKAFMDYPLFSFIVFRGMAGLEQFNVGGKTASQCSGDCKANINYLSFDFWVKAELGKSSFRPWAGLGFDLMFPVSKTATALDESSITNTSIIAVGGGFDWWTSDRSYFPIQIEYDMYPSPEDVTAKAIALRAGWGKTF